MTIDQLGFLVLGKVKFVFSDWPTNCALFPLRMFGVYPYILRLDERCIHFTNFETFEQRRNSEVDVHRCTEYDTFRRGAQCIVNLVMPGIVDTLRQLTGLSSTWKRVNSTIS